MTKSHCFQLWIAFSFVILVGCNKSIKDDSSSQIIDEDILSAQRLFEEEVIRLSDVSTRTVDDKQSPTHIFQLGNISPDWNTSEIIINKKSKVAKKFVEVPISTTFRYRVLQTSSEEKKARRVKVYQELLVAPNSNNSQHGVFVVFYIATNKYIKWNKGILNHRFDNSGDMKKYSGLKIYTDLEGRIIRVNKYLNGKKTTGIFVPRYASPDDKVLLHAFLKEQFKHMHFQYGIRIAPSTRSWEDDQNWSYSDWDQDPYDDGHYYAPDDELDGGFCGYYDHFWFEHNGSDGGSDGYDDSYDPDSNNGYNDWDDDYNTLYGNGQSSQGDDQEKEGKYGNKHEKKKLDASGPKQKFKGYDELKDCMAVAKDVLKQFNQKEDINKYNRVQLVEWKDGHVVSLSQNIDEAIRLITSSIDNGNAVIAGMDYNGHSSYSDNLDALTDHYIVIYGYDLSDEFNIIFQYVETARFTQNADSAFGDNCIIVYQSGNDKMFANHWDDIPNYYVTHVRKNKE